MTNPSHRLFLLVLAASLFACGGQGQASPPNTEPGTPGKWITTYDVRGRSKPCEPPPTDCPSVSRDTDLADRCSLGGFRMIQCGCEMLCTGNPSGGVKEHYDAEGHGKACTPAKDDCTPNPPSAAFQDACSEKGYKLEVCGCEWLCSGNTTL